MYFASKFLLESINNNKIFIVRLYSPDVLKSWLSLESLVCPVPKNEVVVTPNLDLLRSDTLGGTRDTFQVVVGTGDSCLRSSWAEGGRDGSDIVSFTEVGNGLHTPRPRLIRDQLWMTVSLFRKIGLSCNVSGNFKFFFRTSGPTVRHGDWLICTSTLSP